MDIGKIEDPLEGLSKGQLVAMVRELGLECDDRHDHEDRLSAQVIALGGVPVPPSSPMLSLEEDGGDEC